MEHIAVGSFCYGMSKEVVFVTLFPFHVLFRRCHRISQYPVRQFQIAWFHRGQGQGVSERTVSKNLE
jgi:hypothetical protein